MNDDLTSELMAALGEDGFFRLTEAHGGTRLYVPEDPARSELPSTIGFDNTFRLSKLFPGGYIRVPLAREFRAIRYRNNGTSNRDIARKLGITESGVDNLIRRVRNKEPGKIRAKKDPRQIDMFEV